MFKTDLVLPKKLSTNRVAIAIGRGREGYRGKNSGEIVGVWKDASYYEAFRGKIALPWTQVYENETPDEALERKGVEKRKGETAEEALERSGTVARKEETPRDALSRRLREQFPKAAPKIIEDMRQWKGLWCSWDLEGHGGYYLHMYVLVLETLGEISDLMLDIQSQKERKGIPFLLSREKIERMIAYPTRNEFIGRLEVVAGDFFTELDAGTLPK